MKAINGVGKQIVAEDAELRRDPILIDLVKTEYNNCHTIKLLEK